LKWFFMYKSTPKHLWSQIPEDDFKIISFHKGFDVSTFMKNLSLYRFIKYTIATDLVNHMESKIVRWMMSDTIS
jgi:hypothetical protein